MDAPVDERVHLEAHTAEGAQRIVEQARFNSVFFDNPWHGAQPFY